MGAESRTCPVVTTTYEGTTVTKVVPGDVVVGDVIRREDDTDSQEPLLPMAIIRRSDLVASRQVMPSSCDAGRSCVRHS